MSGRCLIVVPMKDPLQSKARLATRLDDRARADFARLLLKRTLTFLSALSSGPDVDLAVVTGSAEAARIVRDAGVSVIDEGRVRGLNAALATAASYACDKGYDHLLILPADLAAPDPKDVRALLAHRGAAGHVVICPSVDRGTNALMLSPPDVIGFHYGPSSAARHAQAAREAGLTPVMLPFESLRYDIDSADALAHAITVAPDLALVVGAGS